MSEPDKINFELEQALKSLQPTRAGLDPSTAAFNAGRRSNRRALQIWRSATAAALLLALTPLLLPTHPPAPFPSAPARSSPILVTNPSPQSLFRLQQAVEEHGIDALPPTSPATPSPIAPLRPDSI